MARWNGKARVSAKRVLADGVDLVKQPQYSHSFCGYCIAKLYFHGDDDISMQGLGEKCPKCQAEKMYRPWETRGFNRGVAYNASLTEPHEQPLGSDTTHF